MAFYQPYTSPPIPPWVNTLSTECRENGTNSWGTRCTAFSESTYGTATASVSVELVMEGNRYGAWSCASCRVVSVSHDITCPRGHEASGVTVSSSAIEVVAVAERMRTAVCRGNVEFTVSDGVYIKKLRESVQVDVGP